jgi:hypothetical protein
MRRRRTLVPLLAGLMLAAAASPALAAPQFQDLGSVPWAVSAINDLAVRGVLLGVAPGTFAPDEPVTRGQFALIISRLWPSPTPVQPPAFSDVAADSDLGRALGQAWPVLGPVLGVSGTFGPDTPISRQQVFAVLGSILVPTSPAALAAQHQTESVLGRFKDAGEVAPALAPWVSAAVKLGVVQGVSPDQLDPLAQVTRAQLAVLLDRMLPGGLRGSHTIIVSMK